MRGAGLVLALCVLIVGVVCADDKGAHLMVQKSLLTNRPFAGKDVPVRYRIFNVGSSAAHDVVLEDEWSAEEFEGVAGLSSGSWSKIPAGGVISHIVVVKPHTYGYKSTSAARVTYKQAVDAEDSQVVYSNDLGLLPVLSSKDDDKLSSPHIPEWGIFIAGAIALVMVPLLLFRPPAPADAGKKKKA